jgi:beta-lactamase regulating signal transducer with metallopeptidase domain
MDLIWTSAATIPAALSAWLAARALEPHLSPRLGVRLWQVARLAAFAPVLAVLGAVMLPRLTVTAPGAPVTLGSGAVEVVPVAAPLFQPVLDFAEFSVSSIPAALLPLIAGLYLAGLAVMAARGVLQRGQIRTLMRASVAENGRLSELAQCWRARLGLPQTLAPVRVVDAVISPFVVGFKPVILAPDTLAKRDDAEAAIAHELMHIKRGDERDRLIGEALTVLMWFNPVYRAIERRLAAARELACDADVLDAMGPQHRYQYAEAIAGLAPMPAVATGFLTDLERLRRRRVQAALTHTGQKPRAIIAMMAGAAILLAGAPSAALAVMLSGQETQEANARVLSQAVGETLMAAQEAARQDQHRQALELLDSILSATPYERSVIEQMRARSLYALGDLNGAVQAFSVALASGGLHEEDAKNVKLGLLQMSMVLGDEVEIRNAITVFIHPHPELSFVSARLLAQAHAQLGEHDQAIAYAEAARSLLGEEDEATLQLLEHLYGQAGRIEDATAIREIREALFPEN